MNSVTRSVNKSDPSMTEEVEEKFALYPKRIRPLMLELRDLIYSIAQDNQLGPVTESLKWGEPSYQVKSGSPIRIDWKPSTPDHYFIYFHCQTKLIDTFREIYADSLSFEGNRAIVLSTDRDLPSRYIGHCFKLAMLYKKIKHLPLLGV